MLLLNGHDAKAQQEATMASSAAKDRKRSSSRGTLSLAAGLALVLIGCAPVQTDLAAGTSNGGQEYVAMGSSFAAGPGLNPEEPVSRCGRSVDNYAHVLARRRALDLIDVSCSGATSAHILNSWNELPSQISALTPDTRLVTVTIGGNDVGYIGALMSHVCMSRPVRDPRCRATAPSTEQDWINLGASLELIADEVGQRFPQARLVFVGYLTVLPVGTTCPSVPVSDEVLAEAGRKAEALSELTAGVALRKGALFLDAGALSIEHNACAPDPWTSGFPNTSESGPGAPFHPNAAGMAGVATALDRLLGS